MGYGKAVCDQAKEELDRRRQSAESAARENLEDFYQRCPQARRIKTELASNAAKAAKVVINGGDVRTEMKKLQDRAAELNVEYDRLLRENGLSRQDVTPRYACEKCRDTGFSDGRMCGCLKQLRRSIAYQNLCMDVPLENCAFESFSLGYYKDDPRAYKQMENIYRSCREYAARFRKNSPSLLFRGGTGLGKTHLSLAIARAAIEKGFGVVYGTAQSFAAAMEKERFERQDPENLTDSQLLSCDLLILDDLGTEFPSQYGNAALYNLINARMLAEKPTIISTNLSMKELEQRYGERFASRIAGYYGKLEFLGSDVRVERRKRKLSEGSGKNGPSEKE